MADGRNSPYRALLFRLHSRTPPEARAAKMAETVTGRTREGDDLGMVALVICDMPLEPTEFSAVTQ